MNPPVTDPAAGQAADPGLPSARSVPQTLRLPALVTASNRTSARRVRALRFPRVLASGVGMLAVAAGFGAFESAADSVAPHPPLNTRAVYDEADGTVGIEWDRSVGALRYDVAASGTVVYSGGWETGATLMAPRGVRRYTVRACSTLCGDWTDPVSVNVAAAPPAGIRYGGGFSDIVWTHNAYQVPLVRSTGSR